MHGDKKCPKVDRVTAGDAWLSSELPRIIDWVNKNSGVIFIVWDEGTSKTKIKIPFLAIGPAVKANHASSVKYDHGSLVRSIEEIFKLPILPVAANNNLADMFKAGSFPKYLRYIQPLGAILYCAALGPCPISRFAERPIRGAMRLLPPCVPTMAPSAAVGV
jgi:hypothetical protein